MIFLIPIQITDNVGRHTCCWIRLSLDRLSVTLRWRMEYIHVCTEYQDNSYPNILRTGFPILTFMLSKCYANLYFISLYSIKQSFYFPCSTQIEYLIKGRICYSLLINRVSWNLIWWDQLISASPRLIRGQWGVKIWLSTSLVSGGSTAFYKIYGIYISGSEHKWRNSIKDSFQIMASSLKVIHKKALKA